MLLERGLIFPPTILNNFILDRCPFPHIGGIERAAPHIEYDLNWEVLTPAISMENLTQFATVLGCTF